LRARAAADSLGIDKILAAWAHLFIVGVPVRW
jgi:hypothetical protein